MLSVSVNAPHLSHRCVVGGGDVCNGPVLEVYCMGIVNTVCVHGGCIGVASHVWCPGCVGVMWGTAIATQSCRRCSGVAMYVQKWCNRTTQSYVVCCAISLMDMFIVGKE